MVDHFNGVLQNEWVLAPSEGESGCASSARAPEAYEPSAELSREVAGLYETHAEILFRYARTLALDSQTSSDGVQETFLRYWIARRNGKRIEGAKAWLFRVLHNLLLDWRKQAAAAEETGADATEGALDERRDPEQAYRQAELLRRFEALLAPRELDCLRLRIAGLRHQEIAEVMGVRIGTVGAMLSRILKKTRELGPAGQGGPEIGTESRC